MSVEYLSSETLNLWMIKIYIFQFFGIFVAFQIRSIQLKTSTIYRNHCFHALYILRYLIMASQECEDANYTAAHFEDLLDELRTTRGRRQQFENTDSLLHDADTGEQLRDLTNDAVWKVSTAKAGNGVDALLDGSTSTYWQSDGVQPHTITASFRAKRSLTAIMLYLKYSTDESYTPAVVSIRAGSNRQDLRTVRSAEEFHSPEGWVRIPLRESGVSEEDEDDEDDEESDEDQQRRALREERRRRRERREGSRDYSPIRAHMIQVVVHCNHQNGRDSHVRMIKVLGPVRQVALGGAKFSSREFQAYTTIR